VAVRMYQIVGSPGAKATLVDSKGSVIGDLVLTKDGRFNGKELLRGDWYLED
jgi:hypothetical protein